MSLSDIAARVEAMSPDNDVTGRVLDCDWVWVWVSVCDLVWDCTDAAVGWINRVNNWEIRGYLVKDKLRDCCKYMQPVKTGNKSF